MRMGSLKLATKSDFNDIKSLFYEHKDIFPHIRQDKILHHIETGNCIYDDEVVINGDEIIKLDDGSLTTMYHYLKNSNKQIEEVISSSDFENIKT